MVYFRGVRLSVLTTTPTLFAPSSNDIYDDDNEYNISTDWEEARIIPPAIHCLYITLEKNNHACLGKTGCLLSLPLQLLILLLPLILTVCYALAVCHGLCVRPWRGNSMMPLCCVTQGQFCMHQSMQTIESKHENVQQRACMTSWMRGSVGTVRVCM